MSTLPHSVICGCSLLALTLACGRVCRGQIEIPLDLERGYIVVVRGSIADLDKLNFVVDTGALPTVIHKRIIKKLRLRRTRSQLLTLHRTTMTEEATLPEISVGPVHREGVPVIVNDLTEIEYGMGIRVDALVGLDVLGQISFSIDYKAQRLRFGPLDPPESPVPYVPGQPYLLVPFTFQGHQVQLMLDTGVNDLILYRKRVGGVPLGFRVFEEKLSLGLAGRVPLQRVELKAGQFGHLFYPTLEAVLIDAPAKITYPFDGVAGVRALGVNRLELDFERGIIDVHR